MQNSSKLFAWNVKKNNNNKEIIKASQHINTLQYTKKNPERNSLGSQLKH